MAFDGIAGPASSSIPQKQSPYEVFINHRGPDVKLTLASTIYNALKLLRVNAFLDREEIDLCKLVPEAIEEAMRSALIHIAIFSKDYVSSPWCLAELLFMQKYTQAPIIPVFYGVDPDDFRERLDQDRYVGIFSKHKERYPERVDAWKRALKEIANNEGKIVKGNGDDEGIMLRKIVNRVRGKLMKVNVPFVEPGHLAGLGKAVENFETFLESAQVHKGVKIVGIVGMSGCGKTTLARYFCNRKYSLYDSYSVLSEVRKTKLPDLQRKLLWDLVYLDHSDIPPFRQESDLTTILDGRFKALSDPVLIVLDDVDRLDQLDALLPQKGTSLGSGSLIIVTTRDRSVLEPWRISVYEMIGLDPCHAKELFCWHAFLKSSSPAAFEGLVQQFIKACNGLPLFIEVVAGMLCGKSEDEWRSKLKKTSRLSNKGIQKLTSIIYDALEEHEKYMFLDVACFFVGEKISLAIAVWEARHGNALETLENLVKNCLVEVDKQNRIRMNDVLRDFGRQIAIDCPEPRFWSSDHKTRILECCTGNSTLIRGIMAATTQFVSLSGRYELPECCGSYSLPFERRMAPASPIQLQLLLVQAKCFTGDFPNLACLLWLRCFDFQDKKLPSCLSLTNLKVLELYGATRLRELWETHPPEDLREIIISASEGDIFYRFPSRIADLKHLTKIALISYHGEGFRFRKLPDDFCDLESLENLELRHCKSLSTLPDDFGKLKNLRHLDLFSCQGLWKLPDSFKDLVNLEYLDLSDCVELAPMPDIIVSTRKLKNLYLSGCRKMQVLPVEIAEQKSLRELHLKNTIVTNVPDNIDQLSKLETLVIGIPHLTSFPPLDNLSRLTRLKVTGCTKLKSLPESLKCLEHLEYLCIKASKEMRSLPVGFRQLLNLQCLKIIDCPIAELDFGPGSSSLSKLKVMRLKGTNVTKLLIDVKCFSNLETLQLDQNYSLTEIDIRPKSVKFVKLYECPELLNTNGIQDRLNPINLEITGCPKLGPDTIIQPAQFRVLTGETRLPFHKVVSKLLFPFLAAAGILIFSVKRNKHSRR